eukprot:768429-Hanusia_phi.AAC.14
MGMRGTRNTQASLLPRDMARSWNVCGEGGGGGGGNISMMVDVGDVKRFGPSDCFQDLVLRPILVFALLVFVGRNAGRIWYIDRKHEGARILGLTTADKLQTFLIISRLALTTAESSQRGSMTRELVCFVAGACVWLGSLAVMVLESSRGLPRGWQIKSFWLLDLAVLANALRLKILQFCYGETVAWTAVHMLTAQFCLGFVLALSAVLQDSKTSDIQMDGMTAVRALGKDETELRTYGRMEDEEIKPKAPDSPIASRSDEFSASLASQWLYRWMNPLLQKGLSKQIDDSDLACLLELDRAQDNGEALWRAWQQEHKVTGGSLSLWKAIGKVYGPSFCFVIPHRMAGDLLTFVSPLLLQQLLQLIENGGMAERGGMIDAVLLTFCILFCKLTESLFIQNYFHQCFRVGWRVRAATATIVYRKIFRLSTLGLHVFKTGQLVDLVSIDAVRLCVAAGYLHYAWSAPMMAIIAIILLYNLLGSSVFAGLFIMIVLLPVNTYVIKKMQVLNNKLMEAKDQRTESMDEVLHAIRVIKVWFSCRCSW